MRSVALKESFRPQARLAYNAAGGIEVVYFWLPFLLANRKLKRYNFLQEGGNLVSRSVTFWPMQGTPHPSPPTQRFYGVLCHPQSCSVVLSVGAEKNLHTAGLHVPLGTLMATQLT